MQKIYFVTEKKLVKYEPLFSAAKNEETALAYLTCLQTY